MKNLCLLLSLLFLTSLSATNTTPWTLELDTGYREDKYSWRVQDKGDLNTELISEKYSDVRFWYNRIRVYTVYKDWYFSANFDYGFFGRGDLVQGSVANVVTSENPSFDFTTTGYTYFTKATGGYQCDLTPMRHYKVFLTPLAGYSLAYEKLKRVPENTTYATNTLHVQSEPGEPLTMHWSGPFLGVDLSFTSCGGFTVEAGYAYSWLYVHQTIFSQIRSQNYTLTGNLIYDRIITDKGKIKTGGALGQSGHLRLKYQATPRWAVGVLGTIDYRSSSVEAVDIRTQFQYLVPLVDSGPGYVISRNYKSRWTAITALAEVDCAF